VSRFSLGVGVLKPAHRGMAFILGGTAGGQLLALISAPILTRVYAPSDFGIYTVISAIAITVGTCSALRFELAVPLPRDERDAYSLVTLGLLSAGATAVGGTIVVGLAGGVLVKHFDQPGLMPWLWLVPGTAAVLGVYMVLNQLAVRKRRYGAIGRRNLFQSIVLVLTQVGTGIAGFRTGGLVLGLAVGQAAGALSLLWGSGMRSDAARQGRQPRRLAAALWRYGRFPLVSSPSGLVNVMGLQMPVLFIAYHYGNEVAGWLGLSQRVLALPVALIGAAAAQVYLGELVNSSRLGGPRSLSLFMMASRRLAGVGLVTVLVLLVAGPWLFRFVFGPQWVVSGQYAQALSLGVAAQLVASPLSQTLTAFERQYAQLIWDIARLVVVTGATGLCALVGGSALESMWCFGLASFAAYGASWLLSRQTLRQRSGTATDRASSGVPADHVSPSQRP
jgi:O-antigen/teichoic acid export membrane protein